MDPKVFKERLIKKINSRTSKIYQQPIEGCTEEEIKVIEQQYPGRFPEVYKIFLQLVGKKVGNPFYEKAFCAGNFKRMRENAFKIASNKNSRWRPIPGSMVFFEVNEAFFAFFSTECSETNDDPSVSSMNNTDDLPYSEYDLSLFILNDFKSWYTKTGVVGHRSEDKEPTPPEREPFSGDYARGWLREGVAWPPAEVINGTRLKSTESGEGWIAPCFIGFGGTLDCPHALLLRANGKKIEDWNEQFIGSDEFAVALLKIAATGLAEGIDTVRFEAMESHWGGFHLPGEEYAEIFAELYGKVKACKECGRFLPVNDGDANNGDDEGPVCTGDFDVLPSWQIPSHCPFCKKKLILVDRLARRCAVRFDPTRDVQDLQKTNNTIQDSAMAVPVLYEGQPSWIILYGTSLSMLLFIVVKEKKKRHRGSVAGIGPLLVLNTLTGIDAICPRKG